MKETVHLIKKRPYRIWWFSMIVAFSSLFFAISNFMFLSSSDNLKYIAKMGYIFTHKIGFNITASNFINLYEIFFIVLFVIIFLKIKMKRHYKTYTLTSSRAISSSGIISRYPVSTLYSQEMNIKLSQSVFQRIFRVGNVTLCSATGNDDDVYFENISNPLKVINLIEKLRAGRTNSVGT